jgi:Ca2+-binding RTX toxin-like protein
VAFAFGFIDFVISGLAPGAAATLTIAGLNASQINDYYKYGATPANRTDHWYRFLFGQKTDRDSAVGTGMQIVGGNVVLRLIDGGRGDDDLTRNGIIRDIGGPVSNHAPVASDVSGSVTEDGQVSIKFSATDSETPATALLFTVTSLPLQGQLSTQSGVLVEAGNTFTGPPTLIYEPGAAREGTGSDSFKYTVTDSGGSAGALSDDAGVNLSLKKAVDDGKVTIDSKGIVRVGGTSSKDDIVIMRSGTKLLVKINGKTVSSSTSLTSVREIRAWGRGGNDRISVLLLEVPTLLHGGSGDDELIGGLGSNLIFGGTGKDKLTGGVRNDLLVGDAGADTLIDALGNDVQVGGHVANGLTDDFYRQVLQQWGTSKSQNSRFKQELTDDNAVDSLFDSLGDDWFVLGDGDLKVDLNPSDNDLVTSV